MQPSAIEPRPDPFLDASVLIEVEHLSHFIGSGTRKTIILNDVSFRVPTQSLFAITALEY